MKVLLEADGSDSRTRGTSSRHPDGTAAEEDATPAMPGLSTSRSRAVGYPRELVLTRPVPAKTASENHPTAPDTLLPPGLALVYQFDSITVRY